MNLESRTGGRGRPSAGAIVVGGEALVDLVVDPDGRLTAHNGGGPFNTARTLARLEQPVHFLGCLSGDEFGAGLRTALQTDGVNLDAAVATDLPTTLALARLDHAGVASYRFYSQATAAPALTAQAALAALPERVDMLHLGTLALVMEPISAALQAVLEAVSPSALVMVDPNCRPSFIGDTPTYRRRLEDVLRHADVVKLSVDDLRFLEPTQLPTATARSLLRHGPVVAIVTDGARGAVIVNRFDQEEVAAPIVDVVDTIGAGDAFGGGFLAWWRLNGLGCDDLTDRAALRAATRFACTVAARTCARAGAQPPRLAECAGAIAAEAIAAQH